MNYNIGSLVRARGRDWVVLPDSNRDLLMLRPLGGSDAEVTGIYLPLEKVTAASFAPPSLNDADGEDEKRPDHRSSRLLRNAVRLGFRSSAGPFRSFARLGVEPRPYQFVPLLMALKLDPVRLLIADDVGVGKTIEAGLIIRELLDRGEVRRLTVLCPPHLAEQWQTELRDKFHIQTELVLASTVNRLERGLDLGKTLFEEHPFTVVSTDFIKNERRRRDFVRTCPELVIVDEAHTCAAGYGGAGGRQQRHQLLRDLAADANRHLLLLTATPHSGNESAFRSLLALLDEKFGAGGEDETDDRWLTPELRKELARHLVQRRRPDIKAYLDDTPFPERKDGGDQPYRLSEPYRRLFDRVLRYARGRVEDTSGTVFQQQIRWWSAVALLRSVASSPAAAVATLRNRAAVADATDIAEVEDIGRRTVLDLGEEEAGLMLDVAPGADEGENVADSASNRAHLLDMARDAERLMGEPDSKLKLLIDQVVSLRKEGYNPIVFCRFIPTAEYVAEELRRRLKGVAVEAITGTLPPEERQQRILELGAQPQRVLVCTDCLSEGVNLQSYFDAVVHYDLSWNPTRHEQREGRVDRYGQPSPQVKTITIYGVDNQIDGIVLDVLIKKHRVIRSRLGISVPVPMDAQEVALAVVNRLRGGAASRQQAAGQMVLEDILTTTSEVSATEMHRRWEAAEQREKRSRTIFAQQTIKVEDVVRELAAVQAAIGSGADVQRFTTDALGDLGAAVSSGRVTEIDLRNTPTAVREICAASIGQDATHLRVRFELPVRPGEIYLSRTHPLVEGLAGYVLDTALDPLAKAIARRCGVIRSRKIDHFTTMLMLRLRFNLTTVIKGVEHTALAEDCYLLAFKGTPDEPELLSPEQAEQLLDLSPDENIAPKDVGMFLQSSLDEYGLLEPALSRMVDERRDDLLAAHRRVRESSGRGGRTYRIEGYKPPDLLGIYLYLPAD